MKNKIVFIGAGSTVFVKNILGDCFMLESLENFEYGLYDINPERLEESYKILSTINKNHKNKAKLTKYDDLKEALKDARFVVNAIQVGGYKPSTIIDFEVPTKYGLHQTIGDTAGIGGIMRGLRTLEVIDSYVELMEEVCPEALLINYSNPMSIITGYIQRNRKIKTIGLCHSVQGCVPNLIKWLKMEEKYDISKLKWEIAGINHMAWLTSIKDEEGNDLYPEIKAKINEIFDDIENYNVDYPDLVRMELVRKFGFYVTESSEHSAEYYNYFIKNNFPELLDYYKIPINEYLKRCEEQILNWEFERDNLITNKKLKHVPSEEYGAYIMDAICTNKPYVFWGNVINDGMITNLPNNANVEVKCVVDLQGIKKTFFGPLPEQLASLNRTHIAIHEMVEKAFVTKEKKYIYMAAMLDPHTSSELKLNQIEEMVDELLIKHKDYLSNYK